MTMARVTASSDKAQNNVGGALWAQKVNTSIIDSIFAHNTAFGGGAFELDDSSHSGLTNTSFLHTFINDTIDDNDADYRGGALVIKAYGTGSPSSAVVQITNSSILRNAGVNRGGAFWVSDANLLVDHSILQNNTAGSAGGVASVSNANVSFSYDTFSGNVAESGSGNIVYAQGGGNTIQVTHSQFDTSATGGALGGNAASELHSSDNTPPLLPT